MGNKKENLVIILGALGLGALAWYLWPRANADQCPVGYHKDPVTNTCVPDPVQCSVGFHYDPVTQTCVPDVIPTSPDFITVQNNPNVTGAWAGVIVTVQKSIAGVGGWSYTLSLPSSIGDTNHTRSSGVDANTAEIREQFFFPPGTHTITGTLTGSAGTWNDSVTFNITQNVNGTFSLTVTSA